MSIFPSSPSVGDEYSGYRWNGTVWEVIGIDLNADYATTAELAAHEIDSTNIHSITDTTALATQSYADTAESDAVSTANTYTDNSISTHNATVTSVHGIADTTVLATESYVDNAIASFEALPDQTGNSGEFLTTDGTNTSWAPVPPSSPVGGGSDEVFFENDQTVTASYTITSGKNAMSTGPIDIASGVDVTIPSGSVWVIL
jgi:hypothetical protein